VLTFFATLPQWQTPPLPGWCVVFFYVVLYGVLFRKETVTYSAHLRTAFQSRTS
jgi:hypothetical protein